MASEVVDAAPGDGDAASVDSGLATDPPSDAAAPAAGEERGRSMPSAIAERLMRFASVPAEKYTETAPSIR